jgi:hypothetical protein
MRELVCVDQHQLRSAVRTLFRLMELIGLCGDVDLHTCGGMARGRFGVTELMCKHGELVSVTWWLLAESLACMVLD